MKKHDRSLLLSIAALSLGLASVPSAASPSAEQTKAIDQLGEIRAAVREALENDMNTAGEHDRGKRSRLRSLLAQWNNWGNWPNWANWWNG